MDVETKVVFHDKQIEVNGAEYSCSGSAEYQKIEKDWDEEGYFFTREELVLDDFTVSRWDGEDWIDAPEMIDDEALVEKLTFYLED